MTSQRLSVSFSKLFSTRITITALASGLALLIATAMPPNALFASQLSGYVYIDRNDDGLLNFEDHPQPEFVMSNVDISLFRVAGGTELLLSTTLTNEIGLYLFSGLPAGTYTIRQTQPIDYVDGRETPGFITTLGGQPSPGSNVGIAADGEFANIVLPISTRGDLFNFAERGLVAGAVSKRYLLGTAPPDPVAAFPDTIIPEPTTGLLVALTALAILSRRGVARSRQYSPAI